VSSRDQDDWRSTGDAPRRYGDPVGGWRAQPGSRPPGPSHYGEQTPPAPQASVYRHGRRIRTGVDAREAGNGSRNPADEAKRLRPPRPNGSRGRRALRITKWTVLVLVVALIGTSTYAYIHLNGNITTFSDAGLSSKRPPLADGTNILLIGSDSRADGNNKLGGGDEAGARSDTTMLLHVYADHKHAVGVSIPRDTLVDIPACLLPNGTWSSPQQGVMFNSAFAEGGSSSGNPTCTVNAVEELTGMRVNHTIVIDFSGFAAMTDAVGGVQVCVPNNVDSYGIHLTKGIQTLKGQQALSYVRARHGLGDGSDIGREERQQAFMSSLLKKVLDMRNPISLYDFADAATKSVTVDPGLGSAADMLGLAWQLHGLSLSSIDFVTMPWEYDGARVAIKEPDADDLWQRLAHDEPITSSSSSTSSSGSSGSSSGTSVPTGITNNTRPATANICSGLTSAG
jgi:LCP family protein required for cell wall assembly